MPNYFYLDANGQKQGPVNEQLLQSLAAHGVVTPQTPMETESGHKGLAGQIPGLKFAAQAAPPPFTQTIQTVPPTAKPVSPTETIKKLNTYLEWFWNSAVVAVSLFAVEFMFGFMLGFSGTNIGAAEGVIFGIIGFTYCIAYTIGMVFMYMLLYQLWKLIPPNIARTTPGKAVGFCFIPFFNLYWMFVAFRGLGEDMNKALTQRGIVYRVNESLGSTLCILFCIGAIPYVGLVFSVVIIIVSFFFFKSVKNGAVLMLEQGGQ